MASSHPAAIFLLIVRVRPVRLNFLAVCLALLPLQGQHRLPILCAMQVQSVLRE